MEQRRATRETKNKRKCLHSIPKASDDTRLPGAVLFDSGLRFPRRLGQAESPSPQGAEETGQDCLASQMVPRHSHSLQKFRLLVPSTSNATELQSSSVIKKATSPSSETSRRGEAESTLRICWEQS